MKTSIRVSNAIALVLAGLPLSGLAQDAKPAQTANGSKDEMVEEVIVTGYRASLRDALEVKRESLGVVEVISSKDIGVLPDVTIAEALARLPGLNTVRDRGNDSQATIRGLGPRMVVATPCRPRLSMQFGTSRAASWTLSSSEFAIRTVPKKTRSLRPR